MNLGYGKYDLNLLIQDALLDLPRTSPITVNFMPKEMIEQMAAILLPSLLLLFPTQVCGWKMWRC